MEGGAGPNAQASAEGWTTDAWNTFRESVGVPDGADAAMGERWDSMLQEGDQGRFGSGSPGAGGQFAAPPPLPQRQYHAPPPGMPYGGQVCGGSVVAHVEPVFALVCLLCCRSC